MKIGEWLRAFRIRNGLSQAGLGEYAGLGASSQISMWENGQRDMQYEDVVRLAIYSGTPKEDLIALWRGERDDIPIPELEVPPKLLIALRKMRPWQKKWLTESAVLAVELHEAREPYEASPPEPPTPPERQPPEERRGQPPGTQQ